MLESTICVSALSLHSLSLLLCYCCFIDLAVKLRALSLSQSVSGMLFYYFFLSDALSRSLLAFSLFLHLCFPTRGQIQEGLQRYQVGPTRPQSIWGEGTLSRRWGGGGGSVVEWLKQMWSNHRFFWANRWAVSLIGCTYRIHRVMSAIVGCRFD